MQKELASKKDIYMSGNSVEHEFIVNIEMNRLIRQVVKCDQLNSKQNDYVFDYDNQFIPTDKFDSKPSYKKAEGYFPGIASINNFPVFNNNRNGNNNVKYKQEATLGQEYRLLEETIIKLKYSTMDCVSLDKEVMPVVEDNSRFFFIRAQRCSRLYSSIKEIKSWTEVEIRVKKYQVASIKYTPFGGARSYPYDFSREKNIDGQGNIFIRDDFKY